MPRPLNERQSLERERAAHASQLSFRKSSRAWLNAAGVSAGAACRPWDTTARRDPGMQRLAVSARIRKDGRVSAPLAMATGTLIWPSWAQLIAGGGGAAK